MSAAAPVGLVATGFAVFRGGAAILQGVSLALRPGEWHDLRGASGSGKSSLLLALARLLPATGELALHGRKAETLETTTWRQRVALLGQRPIALGATLADDLRAPWRLRVRSSGPDLPDCGRLSDELDSVGLGDLELDRPTTALSGGQTARLALLRTLLAGPEVLLLDEPASGLDADSAARIDERLGRFVAEGGAVLRATHHGTGAAASTTHTIGNGELISEEAS